MDFSYEEFNNLTFETTDVFSVAEKIIELYNSRIEKQNTSYDINLPKITKLELQKFLYYIQGLSLVIYNKPAFRERLYAWNYGPIVYEIYSKFKEFQSNELDLNLEIRKEISPGMEKIIKIVIDSYGQFKGSQLINLTHEEEPWLNTKRNYEISHELLKNYFEKVYNKKFKTI